jgi:hypothetical protein
MKDTEPFLESWPRDLRVKIAWALAAKAVGLALLWLLFFRGAAR